MAQPLRIEYPGAFYHVTSRITRQRKEGCFHKPDGQGKVSLIPGISHRALWGSHSCLLPDEQPYHLLLETQSANLSQVMRHINGAYTTYFNVKRKRAGHLFQGRDKSILVEADEYATELSRYVHLNPVRAGIVARPEEYQWSSYRCFIGQVTAPEWLKTGFILGYFGSRDNPG